MNRALRNAVEEAVGTLIDSETLVSNFQLLDDKIYSEAKGYVTSYEIISTNEGEGGLYKVKIKANVALGSLTENVKALGLVREKMNYPRIMVLIDEYIDGISQGRGVVSGEVEKAFIKNKFPIISKNQLEKIKEKDATLSYSDPEEAATLGRRYGAEVVILGKAKSNLIDSSQPYGVSVYAYEAQIDAEAVKTDNAEVIATDSVSEVARGGGRVPTANKALSASSKKFSESLIKRIVEKWRSEIYNEKNILIICENASLEKAASLKEILNNMRDVKGVNERSLKKDILEVDVRFFGDSDQLVDLLSGMRNPLIEVKSKSPNRIDIRFSE